ncbi:cell cycle checkpoint [Violaceomyces palustris]|uniref:Cell cycle checkpoint n=1 Tax=Violaceomyces palustris TaxID=1673888 RepID=A0ACD0NZJ6_9BASI|nr:cell cycle checkpoint [Violaceomyces palustris]
MRFRTTIADVSILTRVVLSIGKVTNRCIIRLTPDKIHLICTGDSDGAQIWSQMTVESLFSDYRIESNFQNQINLEVSPETLLKALRSANNATEVTMRLVKRNNDPLLSFSITSNTATGAKLDIIQDVLIRVLKPADIAKVKEPLCPEPDVHIVLPKLANVRTVVEHLRTLSSSLTMSANMEGELKLSIQEDEIKLETTWEGLSHPALDSSSQEISTADKSVHRPVTLEMKSFLRFLSSYVVATTTIACICENHCAIFYVYIGDVEKSSGVMTFFIPGLLSDS